MTDIFSYKAFTFPKGFLWGSSTAAYQIEGDNIYSDWWEMEQKKIRDKVPGWDFSGKACNSYELFEEDVKILKTLGHNIYRMSLEWARIEQNEGEFHQEEVDHYIKVFECLKKNGIKICLTLVHFTVPAWFAKIQNFESFDKNAKYFERYLKFLIPQISKYVDMWCVFNEFNYLSLVNEKNSSYKQNVVRFHALGYHIIRQYSDKPISSSHAFVQHQAKRQWDKFDLALQNYYDIANNEFWFHAIRTGEIVLPFTDAIVDNDVKNSCDYWAINSYVRSIQDCRVKNCSGEKYSHAKVEFLKDSNYYLNEFNPECIIQNLTRLQDKPVYITENGTCGENDDFRIIWILEYLRALKDVIDMGIDVRGYMYWSLLDNFEWGRYKPTYGLVAVDRENDFKRTIKPSAWFFKEIIENNGYDPKILSKYLKKDYSGRV